MGVQDVVAFLNKTNPVTTETVQSNVKTKKAQIKSGTVLGIAAKKFDQNVDHPPTPPESPISQTKKTTHHVTPNSDLARFDAIAAELIDMHSTLIQHSTDSDVYIQKLQSDVDKYASDVTKVRDYEIRVEYLAQKLEQLSEERDQLEEELMTLRRQGPPPPPPVVSNHVTSPLSPALTQFFQQNVTVERTEKQNEEFMTDFLNVYEEMSEQENMTPQDEISVLNERLAECDRGVQITIAKYVTDLETERLEVKRLKQVVKKQDELIAKLDVKPDTLLQEQVELQKTELENKRELLTQLVTEREELIYRLRRYSQGSQRSSMSSHRRSLRGSLPPTAPPSQPLPPLPPQDSVLR